MVDYYALAGFHCDAVEDRSLDESNARDARPSREFDGKPYAVAPRKPATRPLEIAVPKGESRVADKTGRSTARGA